jgi:hypothetical protein
MTIQRHVAEDRCKVRGFEQAGTEACGVGQTAYQPQQSNQDGSHRVSVATEARSSAAQRFIGR